MPVKDAARQRDTVRAPTPNFIFTEEKKIGFLHRNELSLTGREALQVVNPVERASSSLIQQQVRTHQVYGSEERENEARSIWLRTSRK